MATQEESDEAFARRLQAQEMGLPSLPDSQTPLMIQNQMQNRGNNQNPTVINARLNELSSARATLCAILTVNTPQILAAVIILSLHWNDQNTCDESHTSKWKWWAASSAARMFMYSAVVSFMHVFKPYLEERARLMTQATNIRNIIDALGLIWFVVGNMWLFGDDDNSCRHPEKSPIYGLCISMLIINYIQICLPCIIAVILIPVFCFCMPCLIRVLARLQNNRGVSQGATEQAISQLPVTIVAEEHVNNLGEENTCPICLNEMVVGDEARLLRCKHIFHKNCVDEWLRVNASCPTCRKSIFEESDAGSSSGGPSSGAQGSSSGSGSGSGGGGGGGGGANSRNASVSNSGALEGDVELSNPLQSVNASTHSESGLLGTSLPQADSSISLSVTQSALHDR